MARPTVFAHLIAIQSLSLCFWCFCESKDCVKIGLSNDLMHTSITRFDLLRHNLPLCLSAIHRSLEIPLEVKTWLTGAVITIEIAARSTDGVPSRTADEAIQAS